MIMTRLIITFLLLAETSLAGDVEPLHQWLLDEGHSKSIGKDSGTTSRNPIDATLKTGAVFIGTSNGGGVRLRSDAFLDLSYRNDGRNVKFDYKPTPTTGFSLKGFPNCSG